MAIVRICGSLAMLTRHDIVAGIAGDSSAADRACGDRAGGPDAVRSDAADQEFLILDADSRSSRRSLPRCDGRMASSAVLLAREEPDDLNLIARPSPEERRSSSLPKTRALDVVLNR